MKRHAALWVIASAMVWTGCGASEEEGKEEQQCGRGDAVKQGGLTYCVYASNLVIENGFDCPPSLHNYGEFGPVGVCGPKGQEATIPQVHKSHRQDNPTVWEKSQCIENSECTAQGQTCQDARCEVPVCPDRYKKVDPPDQCVGSQWACSMVEGVTCERLRCPDGFTTITDAQLKCVNTARCYRLNNSHWCTAICPDDYEALPPGVDCKGNGRASCLIEGQTQCARVACGQGYELRDQAAGDMVPATCLTPDCIALHSGKICLKSP